jgi:hypothetical protein
MHFERLQRFDARLREAVCDAPTSVGLAERILAALKAQAHGESAVGAAEPAVALAPPLDQSSQAPAQVGRRWRLAAAVTVAATLALVAVGVAIVWRSPAAALNPDDLLAGAAMWSRELAADSPDWAPLEQPQADFPPSKTLRGVVRRWVDIRDRAGRPGVAYELVGHDGRRATLFAVRHAERIAPSAPPQAPNSTTLGLMIGLWQEGDVVYLLVVDGDDRDYRGWFDLSGHQPLT